MTSVLISTLIPVCLKNDGFTEVSWLRSALASAVSALAVYDYEIILIDDFSILPLERLIPEIELNPHIRVIRNPVNLGLIRSLNRGLYEAKGSFIARLDADDLWEPGRIPIQLAAFDAIPDLALSFGSMTLVNEAGEPIEVHTRSFTWAQAISFSQTVGCPIPHGSILVRAEVLKQLGGYPYDNLSTHSEDFHLWYFLMRFFKVQGERTLFLKYRIHERSVSAENRSQQNNNSQMIMANYRRIGNGDDFVASIERLSDIMGLSLIELGLKMHQLWRIGGELTVPDQAVVCVRKLLFDRVIVETHRNKQMITLEVVDF
jgi:glycosyltransferase involved in cell wall biosynthesis